MKTEWRVHNTEAASLQFVNRSGLHLPIPRVVDHFSCDGKTYTIMTRIPGRSLQDVWKELSDSELQAINTDIIDILFRLWTIEQPVSDVGKVMMGATGHGLPDPYNQFDCLFGPCSSILTLYHSYSRFLRENEEGTWTAEDFRNAHPEAVSAVTADRVVWVHGDLRPWNIMVHNGRLSGIVDWENSGWLPCHWQLYAFRHPRAYPPSLRPFWENYQFPPDVENAFRWSSKLLSMYPI